jgi:hypothetical protein
LRPKMAPPTAGPAALANRSWNDNVMTQDLHFLTCAYANEDHLSGSIRVPDTGNSRIPAFL